MDEYSENYVEWKPLIPKGCIPYDSTCITILKWHNYKNGEKVRLSGVWNWGGGAWLRNGCG